MAQDADARLIRVFQTMPSWMKAWLRHHMDNWRSGVFHASDRERLDAVRPYGKRAQFRRAVEALENFDADELLLSLMPLLDEPNTPPATA